MYFDVLKKNHYCNNLSWSFFLHISYLETSIEKMNWKKICATSKICESRSRVRWFVVHTSGCVGAQSVVLYTGLVGREARSSDHVARLLFARARRSASLSACIIERHPARP